MSDITSANSVFTLTLPSVFPIPQQLEGYAVDDAFAVESIQMSESFMGVDGKKSTGFTPSIVPINITLQADSPSIAIFDAWAAYMKVTRSSPNGTGLIKLPSLGKSFTLRNLTLKTASPVPGAKKVLQPQTYALEAESVDPALV